ncbi:MAG: hypothetical protein AAB539_02685 [Patescibacteria group bacterium]
MVYKRFAEKEFAPPKKEDKEKKGLMLKDVLANERQSDLFGQLLKRDGEMDLSEKMFRKETFSPEDMNKLANLTRKFETTLEQAEAMRKKVGIDAINRLIAAEEARGGTGTRETFFRNQKTTVGAEGIRDAFLKNLDRLAVENPAHFERIGKSIQNLDGEHETMLKKDKEFRERAQAWNIKDDELETALGIEDDVDRAEALTKLARSSLGFRGWFGRHQDWVDVRAAGLDQKSDIDATLNNIHGAEDLFRLQFAHVMSDNEFLRAAIGEEMRVEVREEKDEEKLTFNEATDVFSSHDKMMAEFEEFQKNKAFDPAWDDATKDRYFEDAATTLVQNKHKKMGGVANILFTIAKQSFRNAIP